jgi:hypothetical protein
MNQHPDPRSVPARIEKFLTPPKLTCDTCSKCPILQVDGVEVRVAHFFGELPPRGGVVWGLKMLSQHGEVFLGNTLPQHRLKRPKVIIRSAKFLSMHRAYLVMIPRGRTECVTRGGRSPMLRTSSLAARPTDGGQPLIGLVTEPVPTRAAHLDHPGRLSYGRGP